jgi:hypothetical protein
MDECVAESCLSIGLSNTEYFVLRTFQTLPKILSSQVQDLVLDLGVF